MGSSQKSLKIKSQSYLDRSKKHPNELTRKILNLIEKRKKKKLIEIIEIVGQHVCMIKVINQLDKDRTRQVNTDRSLTLTETHIDIIEDFDWDLVERLIELSERYNFMIFEDRKFADIGNTVKYQYSSGIYRIVEWSDLTNAHTVPGESIIRGLSEVGKPRGRGLLLLAEMSSEGNLAKGDYTVETVRMARRHRDFVIGFISQRRLEGLGMTREHVGWEVESEAVERTESNDQTWQDEDFLILSPGVGLDVSKDGLGQSYRTPHQVICESGSDIIIVGRGIYESIDRSKKPHQEILDQTLRYKRAGYVNF
ncbi:orotidine-5'-phosphate decarboxylase [Phakopsora pachyrhizi]|uniref:Orotidine 5'-phosphate decarboxylase n=1 Tax=Phakopsora pachyrhizi TaxID=170000 RepID=A0AAV0BG31_PHAPC|nr:orotidine-5'-phosphate decarboxylase [Phakopsora pachyrhizi]